MMYIEKTELLAGVKNKIRKCGKGLNLNIIFLFCQICIANYLDNENNVFNSQNLFIIKLFMPLQKKTTQYFQ